MMRQRGLAAMMGVGLAAMLGGCAVGPDYHEPKIETPKQFTPATTQTSQAPPQVLWWKMLGDPMLDGLIEEAWRGNLDLRAAAARVVQARELRNISGSAYWPNLNANGSYQRIGTGSGNRSNVSFNSERDLYQAGFDAGWEIDLFGRVRRDVEARTAQVQQAEAGFENVMVTLYAEIARNYIELRGAQREVIIAKENADNQRQTLQLTITKFRAGISNDLDVARSEAQVASTLAQIPNLQTNAAAAAHRLAVLTGKQPSALLDYLAPPTRIPPPPPVIPTGIPAELLRRRPDVRSAERNLAAQVALIGVATADLFPRLTLNGNLGWSSSQFKNWFDASSFGWGIGPAVQWNLFNGGRTRAGIRAQEAAAAEALAGYRQTVLLALEEVENALVAYQNDQARNVALAQAVSSNQRAVRLARTLYDRGLASFLDVLTAQLSLFVAEDAYVRSTTQVSADVVALYKALGGGWEQPPVSSTRPSTMPTPPATQPVPWVTESLDVPRMIPTTRPAMR